MAHRPPGSSLEKNPKHIRRVSATRVGLKEKLRRAKPSKSFLTKREAGIKSKRQARAKIKRAMQTTLKLACKKAKKVAFAKSKKKRGLKKSKLKSNEKRVSAIRIGRSTKEK